jgi:hypothetical protein
VATFQEIHARCTNQASEHNPDCAVDTGQQRGIAHIALSSFGITLSHVAQTAQLILLRTLLDEL